MKLTIENTDRIVKIIGSGNDEMQARVWEGHTESGIAVQCLIARVAAAGTSAQQEQFQNELQECRPPSEMQAFPLRMVL